MAASMGAVLLTAGEKGKRFAMPNSEILIHQPLIGGGGLQGQTTEIKIHADHMVRTREKLNRFLSERTGKPIEQIEKEIVHYAIEELRKLNFLNLYLTKNNENHSAVISFNIKGVHPHDVASILDAEGVCVRSGNHCAQPLMRFLGIDSTCRASFYIYNTKEDVDRLVEALNKAYNMFKKYIKI